MKDISHQEAIDTLASERYLLDDMSELERHEFEEHYFSCTECAEAVRDAAAMREAAGLASNESPSVLTPFVPARAGSKVRPPLAMPASGRPWLRPAAFVPLAAAASFAVIAGYQSIVVIPSLREGLAPQALVPVVLRPTTRGSEPPLAISPDAAYISLEPELTSDPRSASLTYRLRNETGDVLTGHAQPPAPGARLLLLIPTGTLKQTGLYTLTLHDGTVDGPLLGEYTLTIQRQ
jgi:hypothetical protein